MLSLEQQVVTAVLYAMMEGAIRLSVAPRSFLTQSILRRQKKHQAMDKVRADLENGFQLQCLYIDQFARLIAIFTATPASLIIRAHYGLSLNLQIIGVSFCIQLTLEFAANALVSLWEAGVFGLKRRATVWRYHQTHLLYLRYAVLPVLWSPVFSSVWVQAAVLGAPAS